MAHEIATALRNHQPVTASTAGVLPDIRSATTQRRTDLNVHATHAYSVRALERSEPDRRSGETVGP